MFPLETIERPPAAPETPRLRRVNEVNEEDPEDREGEKRAPAGPEAETGGADAAGEEAGGPVSRRRSKSPTRGLRIDLLL